MKRNGKDGISIMLTASIMTNTLSFVVGFEGSMPRKERKDFPDCSGIFTRGPWITKVLLIYIQVGTRISLRM